MRKTRWIGPISIGRGGYSTIYTNNNILQEREGNHVQNRGRDLYIVIRYYIFSLDVSNLGISQSVNLTYNIVY